MTTIDRCGLSTIEMLTNILIEGVDHAGNVSHRCGLPKDHAPEESGQTVCCCPCGHRWIKNVR